MNQPSAKITPPEGYEIDSGKSSLEEGTVVFKLVQKPAESWEELGRVSGYFLDEDCHMFGVEHAQTKESRKTVWPTEELARAAKAMPQLLQLMDRANNGWKPDWNDLHQLKYSIGVKSNEVVETTTTTYHRAVAFRAATSRDKFMVQHEDLINQAKGLL